MTITLNHVKMAVKIITWIGVSKVSSDIVRATAHTPTGFSRAMSFAGGVVVGTIAVDYATKYIDQYVDECAALINDAKKRQEAKKNAA